jgi:hypothetical protein
MFKFLKKAKCSISSILLFSVSINFFAFSVQQNLVQNSSVFMDVRDLFNKSLVDLGKEEEVVVDKKQKLHLQIQQPTHDKMKYLAMDCMVKQSESYSKRKTSLDKTFLKKMELCCGEEDLKNSLSRLLDNTETTFGHIMFVRQLAEPVYDIQVLVERQNITKEFLANQQLFHAVQTQLEKIKQAEPYFFQYFQKENAVNEELFKKVYWGEWFDFLNNSSLGLELGTRLSNLGTTMSLTLFPALTFLGRSLNKTVSIINEQRIGPDEAKAKYKQLLWQGAKEAFVTLPKEVDPRLEVFKGFDEKKFYDWSDSQEKAFKDIASPEKRQYAVFSEFPETLGDRIYQINNYTPILKNITIGTQFVLPLLCTVAYAYSAYNAVVDAKLKQDIINHLHTRMIAVATYIKALKALYELVKNNPILSSIPGMEALADLSDPLSKLSADCKKLLELLDYDTFTGQATIFSLTGRVLAAHRLMQKVKEELVPACAAAGRIDSYLSVAKLYQRFTFTSARFCFPAFIENATAPVLKAVAFWNPFIDAYVVVTNNLELGVNKNPNNIILTGPNTGGKSTVIKGLIINVLLAQTLGIAPAEELVITPFANLNCYLNITDDLTAGTSLFKAEVLRAKALINAVRNLGLNEFSFTIIDEVFSGTSPKEGEEAALMFAQELGAMDKSLCSIATHFPRLTNELSSDHFKNYKVTVYKDDNDNWVRPYKLEEGKSLLNIAMDLLREEGIFN